MPTRPSRPGSIVESKRTRVMEPSLVSINASGAVIRPTPEPFKPTPGPNQARFCRAVFAGQRRRQLSDRAVFEEAKDQDLLIPMGHPSQAATSFARSSRCIAPLGEVAESA